MGEISDPSCLWRAVRVFGGRMHPSSPGRPNTRGDRSRGLDGMPYLSHEEQIRECVENFLARRAHERPREVIDAPGAN